MESQTRTLVPYLLVLGIVSLRKDLRKGFCPGCTDWLGAARDGEARAACGKTPFTVFPVLMRDMSLAIRDELFLFPVRGEFKSPVIVEGLCAYAASVRPTVVVTK